MWMTILMEIMFEIMMKMMILAHNNMRRKNSVCPLWP